MSDLKKEVEKRLSKANVVLRMLKVVLEVGIEVTGDKAITSKLGDVAQLASDAFFVRTPAFMALQKEMNKLEEEPEDIDQQ